ncbi:TldD/PmbA family protein [Aneurinibacillus terranovensis]|uniref:TldD/PmbA family protein n=1 Tax=Aneurinibacillus terranovensis TaxID=278991 RepID=UPI00041ED5B0|nr:TldD/PmbA family protein [Aneurinibacillus terranovensis]
MIEQLFSLAKQKNIKDLEILTSQGQNFSVQAYEGKIESYKKTNTGGIGIRGTFNERTGYAYTERVKPEEFDNLIDMLKANASLMDEKEPLFQVKQEGHWRDIKPELPDDKQIELALQLEAEAGQAEEVSSVSYALVSSGHAVRRIANTYGVDKTHESNYSMVYLSVVVKRGAEVETDGAYYTGDIRQFSKRELIEEVVGKARRKLGGRPIKTGSYAAVLDRKIICSLLSTYSGVFSARSILQGTSRLEGRLGEKLLGSLTLLDDPDTGYEQVPFDDEGVNTEKLYLVRDGVLESYLHSLQSAVDMKQTPTGHGIRSYKGTVQIAPHRMQIPNGVVPLESLFSTMHNGLYVTDVQGLHSGTNIVSGDFSLACQGHWIENGQIIHPVKDITIAGNFFDLFAAIEQSADDFKFSPPGPSQYGAPSILFPHLSVSS